MCKARRIEFYVSPDGDVLVNEEGVPYTRPYTEQDNNLTEFVAGLIERQYPSAYQALELEYRASKPKARFFRFLIVHRFIRCNFGKFDGLTYDIEGDVLHIEDVACPLKWKGDCPLKGIVCKPKPFGLTKRETEIAMMTSTGRSYDEISEELGISHSTIKNIMQKIKEKLRLNTSKDITKIFITTL